MSTRAIPTAAIIVAAGSGERAGGGVPKAFRTVAGKSLVAHGLDRLRAHPAIDPVILVIAPGREAVMEAALPGRPLPTIVHGGATRRLSVKAALEALATQGFDGCVLVHDAARPFLPAAVIDRLLAALDQQPGAVPVLPLVDTIAAAGDLLGGTLDRETMVRVQTPQAFRFAELLAAHRQWADDREATDDAQMLRAAGLAVATVEGDAQLDKLTYPADFDAAERLHGRRSVRTGLGYDVHRLEAGEALWLCGVRIEHDKGLAGHSDADVGIHALVDALLGALGEGDIGTHFPPSDPQWRGAPSSRFLAFARDRVAARAGTIQHVDVTLVCEAPKIGPHRDAMRGALADMLQLPPDRVSVKATTTERLGFTGRGEGIAAQAVATINLPES